MEKQPPLHRSNFSPTIDAWWSFDAFWQPHRHVFLVFFACQKFAGAGSALVHQVD